MFTNKQLVLLDLRENKFELKLSQVKVGQRSRTRNDDYYLLKFDRTECRVDDTAESFPSLTASCEHVNRLFGIVRVRLHGEKLKHTQN